jgi:hypothetical protein
VKKNNEHRGHADMQPEYDFGSMKKGVRGKHYEEYCKGTKVVLMEPDISAAFPAGDTVNAALCGVLSCRRQIAKDKPHPR